MDAMTNDFGEVLLWSFWFFIWIAAIMIWFRCLFDMFSDHTLSGWAKAGWAVLLIFVPWVGALIYLIARGRSMTSRQLSKAAEAQAAQAEYIKQVAGASSSPAGPDRQRQVSAGLRCHRPERVRRPEGQGADLIVAAACAAPQQRCGAPGRIRTFAPASQDQQSGGALWQRCVAGAPGRIRTFAPAFPGSAERRCSRAHGVWRPRKDSNLRSRLPRISRAAVLFGGVWLAPPEGFEPSLPPPEGGALSPELRGLRWGRPYQRAGPRAETGAAAPWSRLRSTDDCARSGRRKWVEGGAGAPIP